MPEKEEEKIKQLPKDVAEKYEMEDAVVHSYFPGFGERDLSTITLKEADALVEKGFKWLVLKDAKAKPTKANP